MATVAPTPTAPGLEWALGASYPYAWPIYIAFNFTAIAMSLWMIGMIVTSDRARHSSANVLIVGLASSSLGLCITCGIQCAVNEHYHYFANGTWACYFMAYAHYITIIEHLHVLSLIAVRNVLAVCYEYIMTARQAWISVLITYAITGTLVAVLGQFSPPYLQPSGTFCFFGWTSPVAVGFFIPSVILTSIIQALCYGKIYLYAQEVLKHAAAPTVMGHKKIDKNKLQISLAKRLFVFVVVLFVCYTPALIMVIHELFIGPMFAEWDVVFAVGVLLEGVIDCVLYGLQNPELQEQYVKLLVTFCFNTCHCGRYCCLPVCWCVLTKCCNIDGHVSNVSSLGVTPSTTVTGPGGLRLPMQPNGPVPFNGRQLTLTPTIATAVTDLLLSSPSTAVAGSSGSTSGTGFQFPWQRRFSSVGSVPSMHSSRSGGDEQGNMSDNTTPSPGSPRERTTGNVATNSSAVCATLVGPTCGSSALRSPPQPPPVLMVTRTTPPVSTGDKLISARDDDTGATTVTATTGGDSSGSCGAGASVCSSNGISNSSIRPQSPISRASTTMTTPNRAVTTATDNTPAFGVVGSRREIGAPLSASDAIPPQPQSFLLGRPSDGVELG